MSVSVLSAYTSQLIRTPFATTALSREMFTSNVLAYDLHGHACQCLHVDGRSVHGCFGTVKDVLRDWAADLRLMLDYDLCTSN